MRGRTFDPDHQKLRRERGQQGVIGIIRIDPFANRTAGIADEMGIAIDPARAVDEIGGIHQRRDFGPAELILPPREFGHGQSAASGVARLAQIG